MHCNRKLLVGKGGCGKGSDFISPNSGCKVMADVNSEHYFASKVGLPNVGLDPSKDCHHVRDGELVFMFGEREQHKGYNFMAARSDRVKARVQELYPPIFQTATLLESALIPESFARAVVSEVCHNSQMNWAKYAANRCRNKKVEPGGAVVFYQGDDDRRTFFDMAMDRIEEKLGEAENQWSDTRSLHTRKMERVRILRAKQQHHESVMSGKDTAIAEMSCWKESFDAALLKHERRRAFKAKMDISVDEEMRQWYNEELQSKERLLSELEEKIRVRVEELVCVEPELSIAIEEEMRLNSLEQEQRATVDRLEDLKLKLSERSKIPLVRAPSRFIDSYTPWTDAVVINVHACAMCSTGFLNKDVILAPCLCVYHPWCAAMQARIDGSCTRATCHLEFPVSWLKSFGYYMIEGLSRFQ